MFRLVRTSDACPEQYDVYSDGLRVGYMRLRHGHFTVHRWSPSGEIVYEGYPDGDGIFDSYERDIYLSAGLAALADIDLSYVIVDGEDNPSAQGDY